VADSEEVGFQFVAPPDLEGGVYANILAVSHSPYEFTFDWAVAQAVQLSDAEDSTSPPVLRCFVTSRVKVPVAIVFDVLRAINSDMTAYENEWGEIRRPRRQERPR